MTLQHAPSGALPAVFFDGVSGRSHSVQVYLDETHMRILGENLDRAELLSTVQWPERTRHGTRIARRAPGSDWN